MMRYPAECGEGVLRVLLDRIPLKWDTKENGTVMECLWGLRGHPMVMEKMEGIKGILLSKRGCEDWGAKDDILKAWV